MFRKIYFSLFVVIALSLSFSCKGGGGGGGPKIKKTPAGFKMYTDTTNGFKIAHPADWKLTAFVSQGGCNISAPGGGFFVKTRKKRNNETISSRAKGLEALLKMWKEKLVMHTKKDTTLSGYDAKLYIYTMKSYREKSQYLIFTIAKDTYYELIYDGSAKAFEEIKSKIQTMVDTFHITK